jgi:iron complex transport system substrate-binding protein
MWSVRKKLVVVVTACAVSIMAAGCGSAATGQDSQPAGSENAAFPRTITHDSGKTVIPKQPLRIAALTSAMVDDSLALGLNVVALTHIDSTGTVPDYLSADERTLAKGAIDTGAVLEPSLEKIAAAQPDLIISQTSRHGKIYDQLSRIAPTIMSDDTGSGWRDLLEFVASATGTEAKAKSLLSDYDARSEKIATGVKSNLGHAPTAAAIRFTGGSTIRLYVANSFTGTVLEGAGFVLSDQKPTDSAGSRVDVSQENLSLLDADYMFIASKGDEAAARQQETFKANPLWLRLKGEIINVRDDTWTTAVSFPAAISMLNDLEKQFKIG